MHVQEIDTGFESAMKSRIPFVVRGVAKDWPARNWKLEDFDSTLDADDSSQYWRHLPQDRSYADGLPRPDWLSAYWRKRETRLGLDRPIRFWQSPKGHQTPWHYDGNALEVINVQLNGSKHFTLTSPDYELPFVRFQPISTLAYGDAKAPTLEVTLHGGDLIYVPRFWSHRVRALDDSNLNINWVWTDCEFTVDSAVAAREAERLAAIRKLDEEGRLEELLTTHEAEYLRYELSTFGGSQHTNLVAHMWEQITPSCVDERIEIELGNESVDDFISHLDPRGQRLMIRELFGRTGYPGNVPPNGSCPDTEMTAH